MDHTNHHPQRGPGPGPASHQRPANTTTTTNGRADIYQQLIDNDMVKELDDIEAISQQISQHAEVLYNSWKNNNGSGGGSNGGPSSPSNGLMSQQLQSSQGVGPSSSAGSNTSTPIHTLKRNNSATANNNSYNTLQHQKSPPPLFLEDPATSNTLSRDLRERGGGRSSSPGVTGLQSGGPAPASSNTRLENGFNGGNSSHGIGSVSRGYTVPIKAEARNGGLNDERSVKISYPGGGNGYGSLDRQNVRTTSVPANFSTNSLDRHGAYSNNGTANNNGHFGPLRNSVSSSRNSSFSSPPSSSRESPAKGPSITHITNSPTSPNHSPSANSHHSDVGPLELLASPNLSGNLEELVTSFVSTDRAKQAARNTISSTIMRRLGGSSPSPSGGGTASPVRSPSPSPSNASSAYSPLRSPMLTNSVRSMTSPEPMPQTVTSPKPSIASMFPSDFSTNLDSVHAPMQSIFGGGENGMKAAGVRTPSLQSPPTVRSPLGQSMMGGANHHSTLSNKDPFFSSPHPTMSRNAVSNHTGKEVTDAGGGGGVAIPVKIVSTSPSSSQGLRSPSVLQTVNNNNNGNSSNSSGGINSGNNNSSMNTNSSGLNNNSNNTSKTVVNPFTFPLAKPQTDQHAPMSNLFDSMGRVKDPDENMKAMRQRFEEAKQRMALSLPAREGGLRPNSLLARSMFDDGKFTSSWADDGSFLVDQLRRRQKRRMEIPAAPHPELTPQQRQHISERSAVTAAAAGAGAGGAAGMMSMPARRALLPGGGSVAERVLMFEKSPAVIGLEPGQTRIVPIRREPMVTGTALTPWKSQQHELQSGISTSGGTPASGSPLSTLSSSPAAPVTPTSLSGASGGPLTPTSPGLGVGAVTPTSPVAAAGLKSERIVPISRLEAAPLVQPSPAPVLLAPPPQPSFARQKQRQQHSTTFRPPSLHLPGKEEIPRFYFPCGNPAGKLGLEATIKKFSEAFAKHKTGVNLDQLGQVLKTCGFPVYWKRIVWDTCSVQGDTLTCATFVKTWRKLMVNKNDEAAQFLSLLTGVSGVYIVPEDLVPLVQDIVDTHPGLLFLKEATEFHSRYVHTVIARIFYCVNRSWSGNISLSELRRSNFLATLRRLQDEDDINQVTDYFSYEHFYVIYCKFWELDKDHDLFIDREDLSRHNDHALSSRMIERIFCGAVTRGSAQREGRMSYTEFVWFILSEEDKRHPTAIEYWFRCMDLDGDGVLSLYELEYFYEEQLQRMEQLGIETLPFEDCLCQMLDMIRPETSCQMTLRDLKRCKMTPIFFDTFFNLEKYLDHEQRDPFATQRETDEDGNEMSDWDRFAAEEYELLVAEEGTNENMDDMSYEDPEGMEGSGSEQDNSIKK